MWEILGIEPTKDIKKIKSAYAKLAKKFNPEEYPDEFQNIHDAYKNALNYAKRPEQPRRYDNGDLIIDGKTGGAYTFRDEQKPQISLNSRDIQNQNINENDPSEEEFDFEVLPADNISDGGNDFSDEFLKLYLQRINYILKAPKDADKFTMWQQLFSEDKFSEAANDDHFRVRAHILLKIHSFDKRTAQLIAEAFGKGSYAFMIDLFLNEWKVHICYNKKYTLPVIKGIIGRARPNNEFIFGKSRDLSLLGALIISVVVILLTIVLPIYIAVSK